MHSYQFNVTNMLLLISHVKNWTLKLDFKKEISTDSFRCNFCINHTSINYISVNSIEYKCNNIKLKSA